jgi:small conductance mechanosensitive channel
MSYLDWLLPAQWDLPGNRELPDYVTTPASIVLIIVLGLVFRWLVKRAINRIVRRASEGIVPGAVAGSKAGAVLADLRPGAGERRRQRAETMGSVLTSVASGVILAIIIVMVLDQVGVNIAPIIASAGIVGVALGFGAQNLVKDFLSGIFMILEDQYGVGDAVDLGEAVGTVEAVGLRVTRLRDVDGTVWYVRNGEILRVGNQSQNWARTVLDITVAYESDLDQVQQLLKEEATSMYEDEEYHDIIIEPPEVWGVERFDKDGAVVRVVLKTAPLQQWTIARVLRQRIKARFDTAGIRIPTSFMPGQPFEEGP